MDGSVHFVMHIQYEYRGLCVIYTYVYVNEGHAQTLFAHVLLIKNILLLWL